ncbi:hypothetical protein [Actinomadura gamaensis]|uniref:Sigma-70 family RNA polymerase sigma factor n=1 Tax=Actinomadura gamaensis TaxID=1763541 RepID=A0ABV9U6V1_9ACTN
MPTSIPSTLTTTFCFTGDALVAVASAYTALVTGPAPLTVDGAALGGGLPARSIELPELAGWLYDNAPGPTASRAVRDVIWRELVGRARTGEAAWVIACYGVALPGLKRTAAQAVRTLDPVTADDVVSEMVTRFLEALHQIDLQHRNVGSRLIWRAREAALYSRMRHLRDAPTDPHTLTDTHQSRTGSGGSSAEELDHDAAPLTALADAVTLGILSRHEADLITVTRLGTTPLSELARRSGVPSKRLYSRRERAEARLHTAITDGVVPVTTGARVANQGS